MTDSPIANHAGEGGEAADGWQRVHPLSVVVAGLRALKNLVPLLIAVFVGSRAMAEGDGMLSAMAFPLVMIIVGANLLSAWIGWIRLRYRVGESDIRIEQGILSRSARAVPYERIQDVSLEEKPLPRLLGLAEVRFETGAGGKDELKLGYVTRAEGERLREVVRDQRDEAREQVAGEGEILAAEDGGRTLFHMDAFRIVTFGMFEFSLIVFAVLLGVAQQFEVLLPFDVWDWIEAQATDENLRQASGYVGSMDNAARIAGALWALGTILVVGFGSGIVRTALRDWDFRLDRTAKGFRRRRGMFTRTDVVMPVHRVQASIIDTGALRRLFGWHGLSFVSLAQDSRSANHTVAPFAKMEEIAPIAREAGFALPGEDIDWHRPHPDYYVVRAVVPVTLLAIAGLVAIIAAPSIWLGAIPLAIAILVAVRQHFLWRYERHAIDARQILSRRGWLSPRLTIASRVKLHSVEIAQGPLARWCGYADLQFGLAGGSLAFHGLPLAEAHTLRRAVLDSIAEVDFSRLNR